MGSYFLLEKRTKNDTLFTYFEKAHHELGIEPTTSGLEGGVSPRIRATLRHHLHEREPYETRR